jgi:hypothetical protein
MFQQVQVGVTSYLGRWYEHDDDAAGSNNVKVVLIDDGSGGMFVWLRVSDFAKLSLNVITRQGGNWISSGQLSSGTITTGTTLFDTSNDPTSEHHIGKLFAHGDSEIEGQLTIGSGNNIVNAGNMTIDVAGDLTLDVDGQDILFKDGGTQFGSIRNSWLLSKMVILHFMVMMAVLQLQLLP